MVEQTDCQARIPLTINLTLTESTIPTYPDSTGISSYPSIHTRPGIPYYPYRAGQILYKSSFFLKLFVCCAERCSLILILESYNRIFPPRKWTPPRLANRPITSESLLLSCWVRIAYRKKRGFRKAHRSSPDIDRIKTTYLSLLADRRSLGSSSHSPLLWKALFDEPGLHRKSTAIKANVLR